MSTFVNHVRKNICNVRMLLYRGAVDFFYDNLSENRI